MLSNTPGNGKGPKEEPPFTEETIRPRFELGRLLATPDALEAMIKAEVSPESYLRRHVLGDWGDLDEDDKSANELALADGHRIFSVYTLPKTEERIYVITEWDRSVTTLLLPSDY